jgi:3-oxoacyl-[acyl-carrier protein] reductase
MDFQLKGRVAIVTGASQGIGKAIAQALANEGVSLMICSRNSENLLKTAEEIRESSSSKVMSLPCDVAKPTDIKELVKQTIDTFGHIDILVNNYGGPPAGKFESVSLETWQASVDLILMSVINICREVIPYMQTRKWGRIINVTSTSIKQPIGDLFISNTIRPAVIGLAKSLANDFAKDNILVNNVCPGYTLTQRLRDVVAIRAKKAQVTSEEIIAQMEKEVPLNRLAKPEEIANYVVFLASECASYITGTTLAIDGGLVKYLM